MRRVMRAAATVVCLAVASTIGSAAAVPDRLLAPVASAGATVESAERVDNLRLQRITTGSMRGRLVVAGSLDHLPDEGVAHDVVVRMKMTVPRKDGTRRIVGRKAMDYRLPAGVSPQDMTLRWLLSERESRVVDRAGDAARVSVVVRESRAAGPMATYVKVAERLRVKPLRPLPSYGSEPRSNTGTAFIPAGVYRVAQPQGSYWFYTSENSSGAPYIGETGLDGLATDATWTMSPTEGPDKAPDDGSVSLVGGVPTWSFSVTEYVNFGLPVMSVSGSFSNGGAVAQMSWVGIPGGFQCPSSVTSCTWGSPIGDGSVSGMTPSWE